MSRDTGSLIFRQELLFGAVISITAGPTEHLSVSLAQEAAPLASYVSALSDARNPKNDEEQVFGARSIKRSEGSRSRLRRTRVYGECQRKKGAADVLSGEWVCFESEPPDRAVLGRCRMVAWVMMRHVEVGMVRGPDTSRRDAAKHVNFAKWNREFMLQPVTVWVGSGVVRALSTSVIHFDV